MRQASFAFDAPDEIHARAAHDARADDGRRMIFLAPRCVTIKRRLRGMKMHLRVPVESYAGVLLAREEHPAGASFSVRLAHRDPDLSVILLTAGHQSASVDAWHQWAAYFAMPELIEGGSGHWKNVDPLPFARICPPPARPRRRAGALFKRRHHRGLSHNRGHSGRPRKSFRGKPHVPSTE
ncbi:MAG TPA: DUF6101 family protein [Methylocella sp.]|nr:DUF6101 family protein [Methylocella sp.]